MWGNLQAPWEGVNLPEVEGAGLAKGGSTGEKSVSGLDLLSALPWVAVEEHWPEGREVFGDFLGGDLETEVERDVLAHASVLLTLKSLSEEDEISLRNTRTDLAESYTKKH